MLMARNGHIDQDIIVEDIRSKIIRSLLPRTDSYFDGNVYYFVDVQNRFFVSFIDFNAYYEVTETTNELLSRIDQGLKKEEHKPFFAPVMQCFYTPQRCRNRALQKMFLEYVFSIADEQREPLAAFCDPFTIVGESLADGAKQAFLKYCEDGIDTPSGYTRKLVMQRERLMRAGFRNVKYNEGRRTAPFQQLLYVPKTAGVEYQRTVDRLELNYTVDWEKLEQIVD